MKNSIKFFFFVYVLTITSVGSSQNNGSSEDEKWVRSAILDYVEGVYEADTTKIYRSVHPTLVKRGTGYDIQKKEYRPMGEMTFEQLVNLTRNWNRDGSRANSKTIKQVTVYDVQDKTATGKVVAAWGTDYFHLAKIDGKWYIMNVLWQSLKPNS